MAHEIINGIEQVDSDIISILSDITSIKSDLVSLDTSALQSDIVVLQNQVSDLYSDINSIENSISDIYSDISAIEKYLPFTRTAASDITISQANMYNATIYATSDITITLAGVFNFASVRVVCISDISVSVDPDPSDLIVLDGTPLDDGDKITNTGTAGDEAILTYYGATGWYASTNGWTDGG